MRNLFCKSVTFMVLVCAVTPQAAPAQGAKGTTKDKDAIAKNGEAFLEAFNKGDAKALAAFWAADGDYTDQTGRELKGREAIEKAFKELFADNKGVKLRIQSESLRFVTADVAIEDGVTAVIPSDGGPPSRARYTIVHVKKEGQWHIDSVRDAIFSPPTNYEHLRGLEWIIGDWTDDSDKGELARVAFSWSPSQNFIQGSFATTFKNIALSSGTQWIGYDPLSKQIRSWTFDADGSFGEGTWSSDGKKLTIKTSNVLREGKKLTSTNIVTRVDDDTITWQSKERTLDGKPLPDIKEVKMKRRK